MVWLNYYDVQGLLREAVRQHGSGDALARAIGVSGPYLSMVLRGKRAPSARILRYLNLERHVFYRSSRINSSRLPRYTGP